MGWVTLRLDFRLKAYVSRRYRYLWTVRWGNGYTTTLPLEVFTKKVCNSLYSIEIEFCSKNKKSLFESPFRGQYALHPQLVGKPVVDFLFVIIELFRYFLRLRRYKRKSVEVGVFRRAWVNLSTNFRGKGRRPPTTVGVRKLEWLPFLVVSKYPQCIVWFCHNSQSTGVTDRQTDGRTELRLPRPRYQSCVVR